MTEVWTLPLSQPRLANCYGDRYIDLIGQAPGSWPKSDSAHCFLLDALGRVGRARWGEEWTGDEMKAVTPLISPADYHRNFPEKTRILPVKPPPQVHQSMTARQYPAVNAWRSAGSHQPHDAHVSAFRGFLSCEAQTNAWEANRQAAKRLHVAAEQLAQWGRDGVVSFARRLTFGGRLFPMDPAEWNCEPVVDKRFKAGSYERYDQDAIKRTYYIFAPIAELDRAIAALEHAPAALPAIDLARFSDHLQFALKLAQCWNTDCEWKPKKQDALRDDILREWSTFRPGAALTPDAARHIAFVLKGFVRS